MSRSPMSERSFLSDPHLARYMTLQERKFAYEFLRQDNILANLSNELVNEFGHSPGTTTTFWGSMGDVVRATGNSITSFVDRIRRVDNERGQTLWEMVVGNPSGDLTAHDLAWIAGMSFTAAASYMTSGEWVGSAYAGAVFMHASNRLTSSAAQNTGRNVQQQAERAGANPQHQGPDGWMPRELTPAEAASKIVNANRVGSGELRDAHHLAGSFLTENQLAAGQTFVLQGRTGVTTILQVPGAVNNKLGIFEFIISPSGVVTHQLFKPGGVIDGMPN